MNHDRMLVAAETAERLAMLMADPNLHPRCHLTPGLAVCPRSLTVLYSTP